MTKPQTRPRATPEAGACVTVSQNGPYIVTGRVPLAKQAIVTDAEGGSQAWAQGDDYPPQEKYALCRCGHSKKKPFCDGTHAKIGFDGTETASLISSRRRSSTAPP
jgi:CDGSH-type Zn-finger protein